MKPFTLDPKMLATIGGAFYPTGYSVVMFADPDNAKQVAKQLVDNDISADEVYFLTPEIILSQITPTVSDADDPLPSAGTEGATVRAYTKLAREGQAGLLVKTPDAEAAERMMAVVRTVPYSMAQRYRNLVIEDL